MKLQKWQLIFCNARVVSQPRRTVAHLNRQFRASTTCAPRGRYRSLKDLHDAGIDRFREQCFVPERPAILTRRLFRDIPAVERWFRSSPSGDTSRSISRLNTEYLEAHGGNAFVPLELTQIPPADGSAPSKDPEPSFRRFHAPLSLFLQWMQTMETQQQGHGREQEQTRIYLAQCQLDDLPPPLRDDFTIPDFVAHAGRGDIYDTNVWIGHPPTYTPLHRDPNPNLFVQLAGEKVVRLVNPDEGLGLFAAVRRRLGKGANHETAVFRGDEMMQGAERMLLEEVVWGDDTAATSGLPNEEAYEARLGPGDGLFIPKGWWHSIKGVGEGVTASVGFTAAFLWSMANIRRSIGGFDDCRTKCSIPIPRPKKHAHVSRQTFPCCSTAPDSVSQFAHPLDCSRLLLD